MPGISHGSIPGEKPRIRHLKNRLSGGFIFSIVPVSERITIVDKITILLYNTPDLFIERRIKMPRKNPEQEYLVRLKGILDRKRAQESPLEKRLREIRHKIMAQEPPLQKMLRRLRELGLLD